MYLSDVTTGSVGGCESVSKPQHCDLNENNNHGAFRHIVADKHNAMATDNRDYSCAKQDFLYSTFRGPLVSTSGVVSGCEDLSVLDTLAVSGGLITV